MREHQLVRTQWLPAPVEQVWPFFCDARNLEAITPPELRFRITSEVPETMQTGVLLDYQLALFGVPFAWRTQITHWEHEHCFVDKQIRGPYARWEHAHTFVASGGGTAMRDVVDWALPLAPLGELAAPLVRRQLNRIFDYRTEAVRAVFDARDAA